MAAALANVTSNYKQLKEDFVSNLSGGPVSEINAVVSVASASLVLWSVLQARQAFFRTSAGGAAASPLAGLVVDFLLNVCAVLLSITLWSSTPLLLAGLLVAPALFVYALPPRAARRKKTPKVPPPASGGGAGTKVKAKDADGGGALGALSLKPFLTQYRGSMMVITCLAILAVDFRIFPRRFAKVETWGTSLMDLGVGSFVFSAGLVAARPVLKEQLEGKAAPLHQKLLGSLRHSLPLLILGVVRTISVKGLDYAEHVTEYGVHWNFFFTLGLLPPFVAVFQSLLQLVPSYAALSLLLSIVYQVALDSTSLKAYILLAPRIDLVSKNREGLCSFIGYLAIFLAGQDAGMYMIPRRINPNSTDGPAAQRKKLLLRMAAWSGAWAALYHISTNPVRGFGLDVSRRLANLPYVLWIVAFNSANLFVDCLIDSLFFPSFYNAQDARAEREAYETATSHVLRSFNRNGLVVFLVANLLTGLVNMTVPTLDVGPIVTMGILVGYAAVVTGFAVGLDAWNISIKL
jgi:glucosaminylphosphatidylinositol acyltransferase